MVRRYEEPIEVRASSAGQEGDRQAQGTPDAFLWRGRLYVVHEVLDHWQERRAWWRDALEGGSFGGQVDAPEARPGEGPGGREGPGGDEGRASHERQVWRVAASPGRMAASGVYDLGSDGAPDRWLLLRAQD